MVFIFHNAYHVSSGVGKRAGLVAAASIDDDVGDRGVGGVCCGGDGGVVEAFRGERSGDGPENLGTGDGDRRGTEDGRSEIAAAPARIGWATADAVGDRGFPIYHLPTPIFDSKRKRRNQEECGR